MKARSLFGVMGARAGRDRSYSIECEKEEALVRSHDTFTVLRVPYFICTLFVVGGRA